MSTRVITASRVIPATAAQIWQLLTDILKYPQRFYGIEHVELFSPGPVSVGTNWLETRERRGKTVTREREVVLIDPPRRLVTTTYHLSSTYTVTTTLHQRDNDTEVVVTCSVATPHRNPLRRALDATRLSSLRTELRQELADVAAAVQRTQPAAK